MAVFDAYPGSAPQAVATTNLVNHLRDDVLPPVKHQTGATVLVGGFTAEQRRELVGRATEGVLPVPKPPVTVPSRGAVT